MEQELQRILQSNAGLMSILRAARRVNLPDWYVGAGLIRNTVWDFRHGYAGKPSARDVDVAFFDPHDLSAARETNAAQELGRLLPEVNWEPINQARVHLWYATDFGQEVEPLRSTEEAISTWPETATCVGVRLLIDDTLQIYAPYGLDDLMNMVLRRNPKRVTVEQFRQRAREKRVREKWPRVSVVDG